VSQRDRRARADRAAAQVADEIGRILDLTEEVLRKFGFNKYQARARRAP
jgi:threonyl-tRNA synthetase